MTARTLADSRRWMAQGTSLFTAALARLDEQQMSASSALPGWSRKHLVAHVAANAAAIGNLIRWAATGVPTPMYTSAQQRQADIEAGSLLSAAELTQNFTRSAQDLDTAMAALTPQQWQAEVVTAQGRPVPASETPWMRSREVMVHAVDLATEVRFSELPEDFLSALSNDIVGKRNATAGGPAVALTATDTGERWDLVGSGEPVVVTADLADITAYLAGRDHAVTAAEGKAPELPAWL